MSSIPKSIAIQKQIMENSRALSEYYKDFDDWVKEMNSKDKMLTQLKSSEPKTPVISTKLEENESSSTNTSKKEDPTKLKYKRDKNSIKDYYDNWDRVDADAELVDVDTKIGINSETTAASLYNDKKKSNPHQNIGISIKSNRILDNANFQIDKIKREANGNFVIKNFNKSIELYTTAINMLSANDKSSINVVLHNNRGNCHIKLRNYKIGIKDFDFVLDIDKNNIKALYRRGICYSGIEQYHTAFEDLKKAYELSTQEKEREMIKAEIDKAISSMNTLILSQRSKMEKFNYTDEEQFHKVNIIDIPSDSIIKDDDALFSTNKENNSLNENSKVQSESKPVARENKEIKKKIEQNKTILKKDDISKFVYDITTEKLTASSFKYAFRNFGSDLDAKKEYLLKIDPTYFPKIFKTDLDKDTLLDIVRCLKKDVKHGQVVDYLKAIMKINRIKLIIQLIPKKNKEEIFELFDILEKGAYSSEVIPIKDFFLN